MPHKFEQRGSWQRLLAEERKKLVPPAKVLEVLGVRPGETVLDLGAGPGYLTLPLAEAAGPDGWVWAADISEDALELLRQRAQEAGLANVRTLKAEETRIDLPDGAVDRALMVNVLHELSDARASLAEVRRVLKPGGALLVVDWERAPMEIGPPFEDRIAAADAERLLEAAGFATERLSWPHPAHYALRCAAPV
ncbi:MAG: class I SAM-dependent methyltransferase [Firmicutes bacterium]|nr:class I SAM-dependent methyltransferase [Bacillota bacterium]